MQGSEARPRINKKAVLAFVFALLGIVVTPALIAAIVLWYRARRDLRKDPNQRGFRLGSVGVGFALVANIAVLATALAVGFGVGGDRIVRFVGRVFLSHYQARNEARAVEAVGTIRDSLNRFCREHGGYPGSLDELVEAGLLEPRYAQPLIDEYIFSYDLSYSERMSGRPKYSKFVVSAKPRVFYVGSRVFILIENGSIGVIESRGSENVERVIPPPDDWSPTSPVRK